jgi:galactofuranosylgalactofuranosylrhamnosyl-N-acetylglucosaminyl-diphospho-decaprenol beta-1,5/1,6-galactofuranosyltransferase
MAARPQSTDTVDAPAAEPSPSVEVAAPEPGPPSRLTVQRGLFFGPSALVPEDLYAVVERGGARRERHRVVLDPHSAVSTNTYFGRFHATYWQRWTAVGEVEVTALVSGTGRVRLMASDTNKVWRIAAAEDVHDADALAVRLVAPIDRFVDGGGLWL